MTQVPIPSVSAVIPTRNRPQLLERAIRSVLAQSYPDFEIVVVIDGPDPNTNATYFESLDPRVRCLPLAANVGLAEARNEGILNGRGKWIALLDDDDEWLPEKLRFQVAKATEMGGEYVFVPCKFIEKTRDLERVMPHRLPAGHLRFSEYIYCDQGYLQPSMYFMSRKLCLEVPFTRGLRHVEDSDWLLRATRHPGIQVAGIDKALSIYHNQKEGGRESELTPWKYSLEWAVDHHELFTRRAFPFYIGRLGINARRAGEPMSVLFQLIQTARRYGSLNPISLSYFFAYWLLPDRTLKRIRAVFS
jgi:glycosyltransferase involved in cell wall biosynthesis